MKLLNYSNLLVLLDKREFFWFVVPSDLRAANSSELSRVTSNSKLGVSQLPLFS